jgi:hypothetical protein
VDFFFKNICENAVLKTTWFFHVSDCRLCICITPIAGPRARAVTLLDHCAAQRDFGNAVCAMDAATVFYRDSAASVSSGRRACVFSSVRQFPGSMITTNIK